MVKIYNDVDLDILFQRTDLSVEEKRKYVIDCFNKELDDLVQYLYDIKSKEHLDLILKLLDKEVNMYMIEGMTGYNYYTIRQIYKIYYPERYLAMLQSQEGFVETIQEWNQGNSR